MTEPTGYKLNPNKLKKAPQGILPYVCGAFYYTENYEYFDVIKPYLDFPEEPKGIEYYQKELDKEFGTIIEQTKRNSYASKLTAERNYENKFDKIFDNFEYAVKNGHFPAQRLFGIAYSNVSVNNTITSNFVIKPNAIGVGYWEIDPQIQVYRKTKPNRIVRYFSRLLLDFHWKDV